MDNKPSRSASPSAVECRPEVPAILLGVILALVPSVSISATVTIGDAKDNTIFQSSSTASGGGAAGIFSGTNGMGSRRRALIAFDIASNIPAGSVITGVEL